MSPQIHQDEGYAFTVRWCRKLKTIKPGMVDDLPGGFAPKKNLQNHVGTLPRFCFQ